MNPTDKFKERFNSKFSSNKYNLDKAIYISQYQPLTVTCSEHGDFEIKPKQVLTSTTIPCLKCAVNKNYVNWLKRANDKFKYKYDYSKVNYINSRTTVEIICNKHGNFFTKPITHLMSTIGCNECAIEAGKLDTTEFIKKSKEIFGDKYIYDKSIYTKNSDNVIIGCPDHGYWTSRASSHLAGCGCMQCSIIEQRLGNAAFIEKAVEVHGDRYDYSKVNYTTNKTPVEIICSQHGSFFTKPNSHVSAKNGCPKCIQSKNEATIAKFLSECKISYVQEYRLPYSLYRMDFYLNIQNVYIEFHGIQHYHPVEIFGGVNALNRCIMRDKEKVRIAESENIPLITVNYLDSKNGNVLRKLKNELKNVYKFWFRNSEGFVITFKSLTELRYYLNLSDRISKSDALLYASNNLSMVLLF